MRKILFLLLMVMSITSFGQVVQNGSQFTLKVPIQNNGPSTEPNAELKFTIPDGVDYESSSASRGGYVPGDSTWHVGVLTSGKKATIDITFEVYDINDAPYTIIATASGSASDTILSNNDTTFVINKITDTISATAYDYSYGCVCDNVGENDTLCNFCDTKFLLDSGSYVNGTVIHFDTLTGEYLFQLDDPNVNGTFDYYIVCYNCGDGAEYAQNTATQTVYALFTKEVKTPDTSQVYATPSGDSLVHIAGGDTTYISLVTTDGIYGGSGTVPDSTLALNGSTGFQKGLVFEWDQGEYQQDNLGIPETGLYSLENSGGAGLGVESFIGFEPPLKKLVLRSYNHNGFGTQAHMEFWMDRTQTVFDDSRSTQLGIQYGFSDWSGLTTNSLVPKEYVDDEIVRNDSFYLDSSYNLIMRDNKGDTVLESLSSIKVDSLAADSFSTDYNQFRLYFNNGDSLTVLIPDRIASAGSGDNWGGQVVQSDSTLLGNGTGASVLSVDENNLSFVSSLDMDGGDLILVTTQNDTLRITNAQLKAAIDTNTTELTNAYYANDTIFIQDDNQTWTVTGFDSTILTDVSFTNDSLLIQDDIQTWVIDLESLRTTSVVWDSVTSKPTINASGGNITGSIDLNAETLTLTYNDVDTNYYLDTLYLANDTIFAEVPGVDTFVVDISAYDNSSLGYNTTADLQSMTTSVYTVDMLSSDKHVDVVSYTASSVSGGVGITATNDVPGATLVLHLDEDEDVTFADYYVYPDLSSISGPKTLRRNISLVFDVVSTDELGIEPGPGGSTSKGNVLILRRWDASSSNFVLTGP